MSLVAWPLVGTGSLPDGWSKCRVSELVTLSNGFPFDSDLFSPDGDLPLVRIRDLRAPEFGTYISGAVPREVVLQNEDIVIGMDGDFDVVLWTREAAALNQRLCLLRPRAGVDARFVFYALPRHLQVVNDLTYATTVKHLSSFDILAQRLPCPPYERQRAIADYLDAETARIDSLVAAMRRAAGLLDQRRATLLGVVFTGQHPRFAMQPCRSRPLRSMADVALGRARSPENAEGPSMVPYLRAANVKNGQLDLSSVLEMNFSHAEQARYALKAGDVLVTEGSGSLAAVGANCLWNGEIDGTVCFQNHLLRIRATDRSHPGFLQWWARFAYESGLFASIATGQQILNLGAEHVRDLAVRAPSRSVQIEMADLLDDAIGEMEVARTALVSQTRLLQERRQALITAAVTGQIEIPGVAA